MEALQEKKKKNEKKKPYQYIQGVWNSIKLCSLHEIGKSTGEEKMRQNKYFEY